MKSCKITSVGTINKTKGRKKFKQEVEEDLDQFKKMATMRCLDLNKHDMKKHIGGSAKINTLVFFLKRETQISSKTTFLEVMGKELASSLIPSQSLGKWS